MYKEINIKHIDKRTKVIKELDFPFKEKIYYENIEIKKLFEMFDIMEFSVEALKPKHKSNLNYMKHKYRIYDKQREAYREDEYNSIQICLWDLDTYVIDYGFFEEDGNW